LPTLQNIKLIKEQANVPVLVDAGIGCASDAAKAMELGCDGVLMNSAIANAADPVLMASAMKHAVIAGRESFLAGRMMKKSLCFSFITNGKLNLRNFQLLFRLQVF
jgi:thiazole-phosphate synthase